MIKVVEPEAEAADIKKLEAEVEAEALQVETKGEAVIKVVSSTSMV